MISGGFSGIFAGFDPRGCALCAPSRNSPRAGGGASSALASADKLSPTTHRRLAMSDSTHARTMTASATVSRRKLAANRRNARKSTGPRTPEGKSISSRNATTHGIFCEAVVLPGEPADLFHRLRHALLITLNPQDLVELMLCDRIVHANWRQRRLRMGEHFTHEEIADSMTEAICRRTKDPKVREMLRQEIPAFVVEQMRIEGIAMHGDVSTDHDDDEENSASPVDPQHAARRWERGIKYD